MPFNRCIAHFDTAAVELFNQRSRRMIGQLFFLPVQRIRRKWMLEAESDSVGTRAALARQRSSHASAEMAEGGEAEHQQRGNCGKNGGRFGNGTDSRGSNAPAY